MINRYLQSVPDNVEIRYKPEISPERETQHRLPGLSTSDFTSGHQNAVNWNYRNGEHGFWHANETLRNLQKKIDFLAWW